MARPYYDVERGIHDLFHARLRDPLLTETARLGDRIADGFRADFDTTLDMETVGKALVIAAASATPVATEKGVPAAVIANLIGFAGENLVRTARVRAQEQAEALTDAGEDIAEAFAVGDRVQWKGHKGTVKAISVFVKFDVGHTVVLPASEVERLPVEGEFDGEMVECETVLSWHPVTADPSEPIEVPLNTHVDWCPGELGEFQVSTREIPPSTDEAPEVSGG